MNDFDIRRALISSRWNQSKRHELGEEKKIGNAVVSLHPNEDFVPIGQRANSSLVVLMDEQTIFLSYRNKYKFRDEVISLTKKYQGRLQFFIATNDAVLIERTEEAGFIDCGARPVVYRESYSL